jgi:hypothetical protein
MVTYSATKTLRSSAAPKANPTHHAEGLSARSTSGAPITKAVRVGSINVLTGRFFAQRGVVVCQPEHAGGGQCGGGKGHEHAEGEGKGKIKAGQAQAEGEARGLDQTGNCKCQQYRGGQNSHTVCRWPIGTVFLHAEIVPVRPHECKQGYGRINRLWK